MYQFSDDHSRVVLNLLDRVAGTDYINASFIDVRTITLYAVKLQIAHRVTMKGKLTLLVKAPWNQL